MSDTVTLSFVHVCTQVLSMCWLAAIRISSWLSADALLPTAEPPCLHWATTSAHNTTAKHPQNVLFLTVTIVRFFNLSAKVRKKLQLHGSLLAFFH